MRLFLIPGKNKNHPISFLSQRWGRVLNPKYSLGKYFIKNIVNSLLIFNNNTPLNLKILM